MIIEVAEDAGFCYGVQRALNMINKAIERGEKFDTLGPIIHNPVVVRQLEEKGVKAVNSLDETDKNTIFIRTHGVPPRIIEEAKKRGFKVIDATCPIVYNAQLSAKKLYDKGYIVVVVGKKDHPEVGGILGHVNGDALVIDNPDEVSKYNFEGKKVGVVVQTTSRFDVFGDVVREILKHAKEVRAINTRCYVTERRQEITAELSRRSDVMIIVGGKNSSNTKRLYEVSRMQGKPSYHIETPDDLRAEWFKHAERVGISAGASTPPWIVNKVVEKIKSLTKEV